MSKILCPFCFNEFGIKKLFYRCSSASCQEKDASGNVVKNSKGIPLRHIIRTPKVKGGFCNCDICTKTTSKKVCPVCEETLPDNIVDSETKIISVVGAKGSGKSYYVATLLKQIMDEGLFATAMEASSKWATSDSLKEYQKRYKDNLDKCKLLGDTKPTNNLIKDNPPILIELKRNNGKKITSNTFSFFDAAGESFEDPGMLAEITPYLGHSLAVIIILDPRQIPKLQNTFNDLGYVGSGSDKSYSYILNNTISVLRDTLRIRKNSEKIRIPLCVAISKWDLMTKVPGLIEPNMIVGQKTKSSMYYNASLVNAASDEIRSLIGEWEPNLIYTAEQNFEVVKYFGFSAWGFSNAESGGAPAIASYKVEDPIMWVLNREKW